MSEAVAVDEAREYHDAMKFLEALAVGPGPSKKAQENARILLDHIAEQDAEIAQLQEQLHRNSTLQANTDRTFERIRDQRGG